MRLKRLLPALLSMLTALLTACSPGIVDPTAGTQTPAGRLASPTPGRRVAPQATPTPTPLPPPTPKPQPYFTEEFSPGLAHWVYFLTHGESSNMDVQTDGGALLFDLRGSYTWVYALYSPFDYADVRIDALAQQRASNDGAIGLVCRYDEQAGWYEFDLRSDGSYSVLFGQWLAEGIAHTALIREDETDKVRPAGEANEIGLVCQGSTLLLYVNGRLIRRIEETRYNLSQGRVGLSVSSFDDLPVIAAFEWFAISRP